MFWIWLDEQLNKDIYSEKFDSMLLKVLKDFEIVFEEGVDIVRLDKLRARVKTEKYRFILNKIPILNC